jgi:hypothetical protein
VPILFSDPIPFGCLHITVAQLWYEVKFEQFLPISTITLLTKTIIKICQKNDLGVVPRIGFSLDRLMMNPVIVEKMNLEEKVALFYY